MDCAEFKQSLDAYLEEALDEDRRRDFRRHLQECPSCCTWARSLEPSLLFAVAESSPVDLTRIEACASAVTGQIRQDRLARRLRPHRGSWLAAAAAGVIAVIAVAAWQIVPIGDDGPRALSLDVERAAEPDASPPTVEVEMPGEDVRVYQFATDEDADTAVYFIVNPALEL